MVTQFYQCSSIACIRKGYHLHTVSITSRHVKLFDEYTSSVIDLFALSSHENFPPSIVKLEAFPDDETLFNACKLADQDWGNYRLPNPVDKSAITHENYWYFADQAGDFTMAHRDTWKECRGYRETGGVAWMDIEFILTAVGVFNKKLVYSGESFSCHQEHPNEWEKRPDRISSGQDADGINAIVAGKKKLVNEENKWALYHVDIWKQGLECVDFQGGLCT